MSIRIRRALSACALFLFGCTVTESNGGHDPATPVSIDQREGTQPAIAALQAGRFEQAVSLSNRGVGADAANPYPRLVRAIARYEAAMRRLGQDARALERGMDRGTLDQPLLRTALGNAEAELAAVEEDLAVASRRSGVTLELCLACWDLDWNMNGRIDERDQRLLQIEQDEAGEPIADNDPRRKPTFRFDDGDVAWARAFVSFQRAALDVVLAYDFRELAKLAGGRKGRPSRLVLRLVERSRIAQAKQRLLEGLAHSSAARKAYLEESDDDREWVPSPRQRNHPMPLPVDQALYETWRGVLEDVRKLVEGEEGLSVAETMELAGERLHVPVQGYVDFGRMLDRPKDIVIDLGDLRSLERDRDVEGALSAVLGEYYVKDKKPSALPRRLARMKGEIDRQEEGLSRKLRYLFWLN